MPKPVSLASPTLPGKWVHTERSVGKPDEHEEWRLTVDLSILTDIQVKQLCDGALLHMDLLQFLQVSREKELVVVFLTRAFLVEQHGEADFDLADIGEETGPSQWVSWVQLSGSHTLLMQHAKQCAAAGTETQDPGQMRGLYLISARGLRAEKWTACPFERGAPYTYT